MLHVGHGRQTLDIEGALLELELFIRSNTLEHAESTTRLLFLESTHARESLLISLGKGEKAWHGISLGYKHFNLNCC